MQSNTIFLQDRFSIMNAAGGDPQLIFTTQGDQVIINKLILGKGTVGSLNISDVLQSDNYMAGQSGLMINMRTGDIEINGSVPGQGSSSINNLRQQFKDGAGVLRVNIGAKPSA